MMKLSPIITHLTDTDLYKFTMLQTMFHRHTNLNGTYLFKCRNAGVKFTKEMMDEINAQIDHLCTLRFTDEELDYLGSLRFIKPDFIEFLRIWHPLRRYVNCYIYDHPGCPDEGELFIEVHGPLFNTMMFEIYLLAIVNEVYFRMKYNYLDLINGAREKLYHKLYGFEYYDENGDRDPLYTFNFAEFGTRRRLNREWQDYVMAELAAGRVKIGQVNY